MPGWLNTLGFWLGIVGSIVTIAGVPYTIKQIISVRDKLRSTEKALEAYREQNIASTYDDIINSVKQISEKILELQNASKKQGFDPNGSKAQQTCGELMVGLNKCLDQLPANQDEIEHKLREAMGYINDFHSTPKRVESAYSCTREALTLLKKEQDAHIENNIEMIAKASQ